MSRFFCWVDTVESTRKSSTRDSPLLSYPRLQPLFSRCPPSHAPPSRTHTPPSFPPSQEEVGDTVDKFDPIVKGHKAGQLRKLHIKNLRQSKVGGFGDICTAVRIAQAGLGGSGKDAGVLEEGEVLGEGSFGIVNVGRHSVLAGDFAVKMLKEVRSQSGCATSDRGGWQTEKVTCQLPLSAGFVW